MLELNNITAAYNGSKVLHGVSLKAEKGKVTCLVGRNGVGRCLLYLCQVIFVGLNQIQHEFCEPFLLFYISIAKKGET